MAAALLPERGAANPRQINNFLDIFRENKQIPMFAKSILIHRGRIRTKGDRGKTLVDKTANIERSDNWASEFATLVRDALALVEREYIDKIEDDEATASTADVEALVKLHGADAVAAALVPFADQRGRIGKDFRITGAGFQRRKKKQRS